MTAGVVIVHPEWGIFVGVSLGLAFWSALDSVGQEQVPVMTADQAVLLLASWHDLPGGYRDAMKFYPVRTAHAQYATIEELDAAGLSQWTTPLKANRMGEAVG